MSNPIGPGKSWDTPAGKFHFPDDLPRYRVENIFLTRVENGMVVTTFTVARTDTPEQLTKGEEFDGVVEIEMAPDEFHQFAQLLANVEKGMRKR